MAGCVAFILPMFLFPVNFPALSPVLKGVLAAHLVAAMGVCGIVGGYRLRLGLVVLPLLFLALTSVTCWWIVSKRVRLRDSDHQDSAAPRRRVGVARAHDHAEFLRSVVTP